MTMRHQPVSDKACGSCPDLPPRTLPCCTCAALVEAALPCPRQTPHKRCSNLLSSTHYMCSILIQVVEAIKQWGQWK